MLSSKYLVFNLKKGWLVPLVAALPLLAEDFKINLKDPIFSHGVITTERGGIIESENFRVQAQKIEYTNKIENGLAVKKVTAEGDLLLEYGGHAFVGKRLEYDFVSRTGTVWDGRTSTDYWFLGGDTIDLQPEGSFLIENAFLTTVEGQDHWWEIRSSKIDISKNSQMKARSVRFNFFRTPLFWLPSLNMNLKWWKDTPVKYKFIWDQVLKQKISMRYQLYSTENFGLYGRFQYQFKYGPGGAIETDYRSPDGRTIFQTRNFGAYGKIMPQESGDKRFRLQGIFTTRSEDEKTHIHMTYDRLSDDKMAQDFKSDDFELDTQKRTILWASHYRENIFSRFSLQPRINNFQSINQQLPWVTTGIRPFQIGKSGILMENWFSAGYLDYVFAKGLGQVLPSTRAGRFETSNTFYRSFKPGPITWTPYAGAIGIFYTNSQENNTQTQAVASYGFSTKTELSRRYETVCHTIEPYFNYQGYSRPTSETDRHFIFSLDDGYAQQNRIRAGVRQLFYPTLKPQFFPTFAIDLYTYGFLGPTAFHRTFPKAYLQFELQRPSFLIRSNITYNMQEMLFDTANVRADWTVNSNLALTVEMRHRSRYDWRKADPSNFILDIERPISELLDSPLSDGRNTILTKVHLRFSPLWTAHFESHSGWGRRFEPGYNAFELKLSTIVTGQWRLEFGVSFDPGKKWQSITPSFKLTR